MSTGTSSSFAGAQVFAPGRVAFVTGAGSGIGKAVCKNCASRGMKVVLCDFNESALKQAEAELILGSPNWTASILDTALRKFSLPLPQTALMVSLKERL